MPIEKWSDRVVVGRLADDPQFSDDMLSIDDAIAKGCCDVVLDLSALRYVNSSNLARLLKLRKNRAEHRLVLCSVPNQVWGTFLVTGLDKVFEFSDNVATALATLQMA